MYIEQIIIISIPIGVFLIAAVLAFFHVRAGYGLVLTFLALVWAGFTSWMIYGAATAPGWDGLGYSLALIGISGPTAIGFIIGGIFGWVRGRKTAQV